MPLRPRRGSSASGLSFFCSRKSAKATFEPRHGMARCRDELGRQRGAQSHDQLGDERRLPDLAGAARQGAPPQHPRRVTLRRCTMNASRARFAVWLAILTLAGCRDSSDPAQIGAPSFAKGGVGRPSVLVNPNANDNGTAKTIAEGIAMIAAGGKVMVLPGTYAESLVIDKGLTLEAVGGESGPVIVAPPATGNAAIPGATPDPG